MASNHTFVNYNSSGLHTHRLQTCWLVSSSASLCQEWVGPKFHSLLSAHHLIGAYFRTTESNKHMRLLTRLYGNPSGPSNKAHPLRSTSNVTPIVGTACPPKPQAPDSSQPQSLDSAPKRGRGHPRKRPNSDSSGQLSTSSNTPSNSPSIDS